MDIPAGSFVERRVFLIPEVRLPLETHKSKPLAVRAEIAFNVVTDSTTHLYRFHAAPFTLRYAAPDDVDNKLNAELKRLKKSGPDYGSEQYLFGVENIIKRYASPPLATPLCRDYLTASQTILHDYKTRRKAIPDFVFVAIGKCLNAGEPYADIVYSHGYLEFLLLTRYWEAIEKVAEQFGKLQTCRTEVRVEGVYIGTLLVMPEAIDIPSNWQRRLREPLKKCLQRSFNTGSPTAVRSARQLLHKIEQTGEWQILTSAAKCVLHDNPHDEEAQKALELAESKLN